MRIKSSLLLLLSLTVTWSACENAPDPDDQTPLGPVFAKGGPGCDTKAAPVREYFLEKSDQQFVDGLFRDLATYCADGDGTWTLNTGFQILEKVQATRGTKDSDGLKGDAADGAMVAYTALSLMNYVCGLSADCQPAAPILPDPVQVLTGALSPGGAFGVVQESASDRVFTYGSSPYWFVEPFGSAFWGVRSLVLGSPTEDPNPLPDETPLDASGSFSLDWQVVYFAADGLNPVSVTLCETAVGNEKKEKIAHGGALLQEGNYYPPDLSHPCYVTDPTVAIGLTARLSRLAAATLPFWPQPLLAGFTGGSASGKATEFSPFFGLEIDPVGKTTFITVPLDSWVDEPICAVAASSGESECPEDGGIRVLLTTSNESPLSGDEMVYLRITAEDNNGSWQLEVEPKEGQRVDEPGLNPDTGKPYGLVYEWTNISLTKPGAYKLHTYYTDAFGCVKEDDGTTDAVDQDGNLIGCGPNTVGIAFPAATSEKFIVNP
ncbi:MAG: hypothetical protein P8125_03150 [Gemmatimonadota bacterium]